MNILLTLKYKFSQQQLVGFYVFCKIVVFMVVIFMFGCGADPTEIVNYDSPKDLTVSKISNGKVQLAWNYNTQSTNVVYIVAKKSGSDSWIETYYTSSDDSRLFIDDIPTNSYTVYSYKVKAKEVETQKESYFSNPATYFPEITVPTNFQVTQQGQTLLKLTWADNVLGEAGYKIDKKINNGSWVTEYASLSENVSEYNDEINELYQTISYRVYAFVGDSNSPYSEITFTPTIQIPGNLLCSQVTQSQIRLDWEYGTDSPNYFDIQRKIGVNDWSNLQRISGSNRYYIDNLAIESGTISYRIRSIKDTLYSAYSEESSINFNIKSLSTLSLNYPGNQLIYNDNKLYIANDYNGAIIVDVNNPTEPSLVNTLSMPGKTMSVCIDGNLLYMTNSESLLRIYDISDINNPIFINDLAILGQGYDLIIKSINNQKYAFIAAGSAGLITVALNDPNIPEPYVLNRYNTNGTALNIDYEDQIIYLADASNGVIKLNVSDPSQPQLLKHYTSLSSVNDIVLGNQFVYTANGDQGVSILSRSDLTMQTTYDTQGYSNAIAVDNRNIYIADRDNGLLIASIVNPGNIYSLCHIPSQSYVNSVAIHNKYAYIVTDNQLNIIQIRP